jgi:hypothetical protein
MQRLVWVFLVVALAAVMSTPAAARDRWMLEDVEDMWVVIEDVNDVLKDYNLTQSQIRTDVELRLRKAGIVLRATAEQWLYVNVNAISQSYGIAYNATVEFDQPMILLSDARVFRDAGFEVTDTVLSWMGWKSASIWRSSLLGTVGSRRDPEATVRAAVGDLVDEFINDYLAARQDKVDRREKIKKTLEEAKRKGSSGE